MQELNTSRFGVISYNPENAIIFPKGIIQLEGYENCTSYHLFHEEDGNRVLHYLQSLDDPELSFTLVDPTFLNIDYDLELSDEETELMKVQGNGEDELVIMLMVYRPVVIEGAEVKTSEEIKAQTQSPLIINISKRVGIQKVGLRGRLVFTNRPADD
jgi:flagellar assembly factor FliW